MATNCHLGLDKGDMEELLQVVPGELTNGESLGLKQDHMAEAKARENETAEEKQPSISSLKSLKTWTPTQKGSHSREECSRCSIC